MKKTHAIILLVVSTLLVFSVFITTVLGITTGMSVLEAVLVAIETEESEPDGPDAGEPVESLPVVDTIVLGDEDYFDELHKLILTTDIEAIPDDVRLSQGVSGDLLYVSNGSGGVPLKTYLYIYQLLAEICMRPEINPKDAGVKITPMDLIGECVVESGFMNGNATSTAYDKASGGTGFYSSTALYWQTEEDILSKTEATTVFSQITQALSGVDLGVDYIESYICVGPLAESLIYTFNWDSQYNPKSCIYISKEENPDIDDDKRAIYGVRKDIYTGKGIYVYDSFWDGGHVKGEMAPVDEIQANLRQGFIDIDTPMKYGSRPACFFTADAFYTHALSIRAALLDVDPANFNASYGKNIDGFEDFVFANGQLNLPDKNGDIKKVDVKQSDINYAKIALALNCFMGSGWSVNDINGTRDDPTYRGLAARIYGEMVYNGVPMLGVAELSRSAQKSLASIPTQIDGQLVLGVSQAYTYWEYLNHNLGESQYDELSAMSVIANNISLAAEDGYYDRQIFNDNRVNVWYLSLLNASDYFTNVYDAVGNVPENYSELGQYLPRVWYADFASLPNGWSGNREFVGSVLYGYRCINAGYVYLHAFDTIVHELNLAYPLESGSPSIFFPSGIGLSTGSAAHKLIDGLTPIEGDCLDPSTWGAIENGEHFTSAVYLSSDGIPDNRQYGALQFPLSDAADILDGINPEKIDLMLGDQDITSSTNSAYAYSAKITGMHKPLHKDNKTDYALRYATYRGHTGVDIVTAWESDPDGITGKAVSPITDGVIVMITKFPYDFFEHAGLSYGFQGYGGYGNCVWVLHKDKDDEYFISMYAHLTDFGHIAVGSVVNSNTVLGYAGSTGKSTGPHLHLEVRYYDDAGKVIKNELQSGVFIVSYSLATSLEGTNDYEKYGNDYDLS